MDKKSPLLLVAESHPIQYRAPVYARLNQIYPGAIHVVYASDFSLRGGRDPGFGLSVAWDTDLLAGYPSTVLSSRLDRAPTCWNDLDGSGLAGLVKRQRPEPCCSLRSTIALITSLICSLFGGAFQFGCAAKHRTMLLLALP